MSDYGQGRIAAVLARIREAQAKAWDEGHGEACYIPHGCQAHENPYRNE